MLVANAILVATLFFTSFAIEEKWYTQSQRFRRQSDDYNPPQGNYEDQQEIGKCRNVNFFQGKLGYVNVFAFLDTSSEYSYRQAVMLRLLKKRFKNAGFSNILFFIVKAPPNVPDLSASDAIEMKTWAEIIALESEYIFNLGEILLNDVEEDGQDDIIIIQDTPELRIWESVPAAKNEIIVVDRCGKLTYQMLVPWSILYFPYVRAAILSTYKEDPCGPCIVESTSTYKSVDYEKYFLGNVTNEKIHENSDLQEERNFTEVELNNVTKLFDEIIENENDNNRSVVVATEINLNIDDPTTSTQSNEKLSDVIVSTTENIINEDSLTVESSTVFNVSNDTDTSILTMSGKKETEDLSVVPESSSTEGYEKLHDQDFQITIDSRNSKERDYSTEHEGLQMKSSYILPMRILMRDFHLDRENDSIKSYTTLILKTDDPNYHEHYDTGEVIGDTKDGFEQKNPDDNVNREEIANDMNSESIINENFDDNSNFTKLIDVEESTPVIEEDKNYPIDSSGDGNPVDMDNRDEETQQKLIEHYNKLLPWINYILKK